MNVITRLEFDLADYDSAVHHFNHYTTQTPPRNFPIYGIHFPEYSCYFLFERVVSPIRVLSSGKIEQTMCANKWPMLNYNCCIAILNTISLWAKKELRLCYECHLQNVFTNHRYIFINKKRSCHKITYNGWYYLPTPPLGQDMTQGQFLIYQIYMYKEGLALKAYNGLYAIKPDQTISYAFKYIIKKYLALNNQQYFSCN